MGRGGPSNFQVARLVRGGTAVDKLSHLGWGGSDDIKESRPVSWPLVLSVVWLLAFGVAWLKALSIARILTFAASLKSLL